MYYIWLWLFLKKSWFSLTSFSTIAFLSGTISSNRFLTLRFNAGLLAQESFIVYSEARLSCLNSSKARMMFLASYYSVALCWTKESIGLKPKSDAALGFRINWVPIIGVAYCFSISEIFCSIYYSLFRVEALSWV
jgi:hypothetical protein